MSEARHDVDMPDGPAFTLPVCFPPSHGIRGADGRTTYRAETAALIEGYRNLLIDVIVPGSAGDTSPPVIVWIHGGAFVMGASEEVWSPWFPQMQEKVLAAGCAFASLTYRFSAEAPFPAQLVDIKAGLRYLREFAAVFGVDADRVVLWGGSAGAQLALLAALTTDLPIGSPVGVQGPDVGVCAVVDFYGPTEIAEMPPQDVEADGIMARLLGGPLAENRELGALASPITHLHDAAPPILIFHGTADHAVSIDHGRRFASRALAVGTEAELVEVDGADHGFATIEMDAILNRAIEFSTARMVSPQRGERRA